jgi:hypothetical protein
LGEATGDAELTADAATLFHALEAVMRLLAGRLGAELDVRPVDVEAVLELTGRLAWAAAEAKRIA